MRPVLTSVLLAALLAAACTSGSPTTATTEPSPSPLPEGVFRMQGCEPRSLLPAAATSECGEQVVSALYTPLVQLDPHNGRPRWGRDDDRAVAERISTSDGREWTIVLEAGWQFHDGQPVTAQSFVDAWNFAAVETNAQPRAWLLQDVAGFDDVRCGGAECTPVRDRLTGVRAISDQVLRVTLDRADHTFPRRLGHPGLAPLPPTAFDDLDAFGQAPVGNGPMRIEGTWEHDRVIRLRRVEPHAGTVAASAGVDVVLFRDPEAARRALLAGDLDLAAELDPEQVASVGTELTTVTRDGDDLAFLVVPTHEPSLDDPRLAEALSRAIDRRALIREHLAGAARPATGLVPAVAGAEVPTCADACRYDPEGARRLLAEVGLPERGLELWYDRNSAQGDWVEAIMAQWRRTLDLSPSEARLQSLPHDQFVAHLDDRLVTGLYALGWSMDLPSAGEYLGELHGAAGLFNFDGYRDPEVQQQLATARTTDSEPLRDQRYGRVERLVADDWHHVPLWVTTHQAVHGSDVAGVELDGWGRIMLARVEVVA